MAKPVLQLAAVGFLGIALWKIISILLFPLLGAALGFFFIVLKVALIAGLIYFLFWMFNKKKSEPKDGEAPAA
jgi:hypothetical protein